MMIQKHINKKKHLSNNFSFLGYRVQRPEAREHPTGQGWPHRADGFRTVQGRPSDPNQQDGNVLRHPRVPGP